VPTIEIATLPTATQLLQYPVPLGGPLPGNNAVLYTNIIGLNYFRLYHELTFWTNKSW
jgi:hypothetical protein